ncbi:AarF/ABC1/UbiB kinase family protein [Atopobium sp. oral taxon 416]|uniref:ABC1 kinase family protein n=1 Tax=Atopobium sp. oral taxon 416 TaxID=712157 RepID=UPI00201137FF|nr:lipopolysaccharide core heptose(II) kinase RfaY [Atopobium sp. oral taxon 416]
MERSEPSDNTDTTSRASVDSQEETDAYDNMFQAIENEEYDQTIGLRGGRYTTYRTGAWQGRLKRMHEIFSVVRKYDIMHGMTPVTLRRMLEELGPTFVKAGQILSMRSEILPEPFCQELSKLQANVIPMDRETVLSSLRAEYAIPIEDLFDAIDDVPLGSASIAQVHRARLITGEDVAIKIQRPHVQETMAQDIDIMRRLARYADRFFPDTQVLDLGSVIEELWHSFREETDFLVEARNLAEFRRDNANIRYVGCPKPYLKLCTLHVVVMDYIEGIPISHTAQLIAEGYDLNEIGTKLVDNYTQQMLDSGFFHADPHPGNLIIKGGKIYFIDLGMMGRLSSTDRAALRDMVTAVALRDSADLKDGLLEFAVSGADEVDHAQLLSSLDEIIEKFGNADLKDFDMGAFVNALFTMARRCGIELPSNVTMLARSLVTLEGTVNDFLSDTSIIQIIRTHIRTQGSLGDLTKQEAKTYAQELERASHGLLQAAGDAGLASKMLTRGQLRMILDLSGTKSPIADLSHAADRLTMGIVAAGLFIGSSIIYYARIQPVIFGIPIIGFVGFFIALFLGLWIVFNIIKEHKRDHHS